jgi:hypothetical protein
MKQPMTDWACPARQGRVAVLQDYRPTPVVPTPILSNPQQERRRFALHSYAQHASTLSSDACPEIRRTIENP